MSILLTNSQSNVFRLAKGLELLAKAKQRKIGYEKWNDKTVLFFSNYEQEHKVLVIAMAIARLEKYCLILCAKIAQSL